MRCLKPHALGMVLILLGFAGCQSGGSGSQWNWWSGTPKTESPENSSLAGSPYDGVKLPSQVASPEALSKGKSKTTSGAQSLAVGTPPGTPSDDPYAVADIRPKSYPSTSYPSTATNLSQGKIAAGFDKSPQVTNPNYRAPSTGPVAQASGAPTQRGPYGGGLRTSAPARNYPNTSATAVTPADFGKKANATLGGSFPTAGPANTQIGPRYASLPRANPGARYDAPNGPARSYPTTNYPTTSAPANAPARSYPTTNYPTTSAPANAPAQVASSYPVVGAATTASAVQAISPAAQVPGGQHVATPAYPSTVNAVPANRAPIDPFRPGSTSTYVLDRPAVGTPGPPTGKLAVPPVQAPYNPPAIGTRYGSGPSGPQ